MRATGPSRFDVCQRLVGRLEQEDSIHDGADDSGFDQRCDLAQLLAVRAHVQERIADATVIGLASDAETPKAQNLT